MAANLTQDRFEKPGTPVGDVTDIYSGTPIGSATVPVEPARLVHTPIAGGTPAPPAP